MKANRTRRAAWGLTALAGLLTAAGQAQAVGVGPVSRLNIDVTISQNLSVAVNDVITSTVSTTWDASIANDKLVPTGLSTSTVRNDSGAQTEKWALATNLTSLNTQGGAQTWALDTTTTSLPGADEFAVQAVFGSSNTVAGGCPSATSNDWDQAYAKALTNSNQTYGDSAAGNFAASSGDAPLTNLGTAAPDSTDGSFVTRLKANSKRALCWRIIAPNSTSTSQQQNVQIIVTAWDP